MENVYIMSDLDLMHKGLMADMYHVMTAPYVLTVGWYGPNPATLIQGTSSYSDQHVL